MRRDHARGRSTTPTGDIRAFSVERVDWKSAADALTAVRSDVFVREQGVPAELESDGRDAECAHVLARASSGEAIGAGRLASDGRIGRMAVLAAWRGQRVGAAMLRVLIAEARRRGLREVYLHAQTRAVRFYARHGFVTEGDEYLEAGIPHVGMRARL